MRSSTRWTSVGIGVVVAISMIAVACTPGGPPTTSYKVAPHSVTVNHQEDRDGGDEPYVIQLGFRSKMGVKNSTEVTFASQCYKNKLPRMDAAPSGTTLMFPERAADIVFDNVQRLDIGDLALNTAPFEVIGTLTFVVERDAILGGCAISDLLKSALRSTLKDALELLIARSNKPPTTDDLIDLIVGNIGNFLSAAVSLIGAAIEGLGDPDDIIGIAAQIYLPTSGALTDLIQTGLSIGGLFAPGLDQGIIPLDELVDGFPENIAVKVGALGTSKSKFDFKLGRADYTFTNSVVRG